MVKYIKLDDIPKLFKHDIITVIDNKFTSQINDKMISGLSVDDISDHHFQKGVQQHCYYVIHWINLVILKYKDVDNFINVFTDKMNQMCAICKIKIKHKNR